MFYGVPISFPCPNCEKHKFIENFSVHTCGFCGHLISIDTLDLLSKLVNTLVKDRDKWKKHALDCRAAHNTKQFILIKDFNNWKLIEKI